MRSFSALLGTILVATLATVITPSATAQTVRDSVRIDLVQVNTSGRTEDGNGFCSARAQGFWPNVLQDVLGTPDRSYGYSDYSLVATEGQFVPTGFGQIGDLPDGILGHDPQIGGSQFNFNPDGPIPDCAPQIRAVAFRLSGAWGFRNARPFRITDWYAVFSVPSGTPIALFEWEQTEGFTVEFDGFAADLSLSREVDITAPGGKRPVVAYAWDFGDGSTASGPAPRHTYAEEGTYEVTLTVTDDDGEENARTVTVTVEAARLAVTVEAMPSEANVGEEIDLVATVTNVGTAPVFDVEVGRVFAAVLQLPEAENLEGRQFGGQSIEPVALAEGEPTEERRDRLDPGASVEVSRSYLVERPYGVREGFSGPYNPLEGVVNWKLTVAVGVDGEGEAVPVLDECEEIGSCPDSTRILKGPLVVRPQMVNQEGTRGDTLVARVQVENTGTVGLVDVQVPADFTFDYAYADTIDVSQVRPPELRLVEGQADTTLAMLTSGSVVEVDRRYVVERLAEIDVQVTPDSVATVTIEAEAFPSLDGAIGFADTEGRTRITARQEAPESCPFGGGALRSRDNPGCPVTLSKGLVALFIVPFNEEGRVYAVGSTYQLGWTARGVERIVIDATTVTNPDDEDFTLRITPKPVDVAQRLIEWEPEEAYTSPTLTLRIRAANDPDIENLLRPIAVRDTTWMARIVEDGDGQQTYEYFEPSKHAWSFANNESSWFPLAAWSGQDSLRYRPDLDPGITLDPVLSRAVGGPVRYNRTRFSKVEPVEERGSSFNPARGFPTWPALATAFGTNVSYVVPDREIRLDGERVNVPRTSVFDWWRNSIIRVFGGVCYGMSLSTLQAFWDQEAANAALGVEVETLADVGALSPQTYGRVHAYQLYQFDRSTQARMGFVSEVLDHYRTQFASDDRSMDRILGIVAPQGGHAVVPYRMEQLSDDLVVFHIYDPNRPLDDQAELLLNPLSATYSYASPSPRLDFGSPCSLQDCPISLVGDSRSVNRAVVPSLSYTQTFEGSPEQGGPGLFVQARSDRYTLANTSGQTLQYADSTVTNGIAGASALFELTGQPSTPRGITLPPGTYTLDADLQANGAVRVRRGNEVVGVTLDGGDAGPLSRASSNARASLAASPVTLTLPEGGRFAVRSEADDAQPFSVSTLAMMADREERFFELDVASLAGGEAIATTLAADSTALRVEAPASATTYRLFLTHALNDGYGLFAYDDVPLEGGSIHTIRPPWGTLNDAPVEVDVDRDGDGTVDETLRLENQIIVADEPDAPAEVLPEAFALNAYPNPTASAATIDIALPEAADVRAEVFDLLGRRVATLHDGLLAAGTHSLTLDAARLPAGVYVVRGVTPEATLTKRLTVVR